ncbi:ANTAR domain-containing protein [Lactonifactor longoviformis]|uniref:Response regulator NasT n=1 Tax=Lactonifactor longoviformis DSM 17459 TaxID=1122155 RepID=A0A1M4Y0F0_9CLOT|nr:ANTAR domain-containing protein [Lactonifactor longoviformis]POP32639.1 ANTAR domain-containing protein [Lactonifactor longoviformis]SHE99168.1 response regulator NasT [Lactonifactor longoviformis DSM 17459]
MSNMIVLFPKQEDGKNIRNLLVRHGYEVTAVCTTGAQALHHANTLNDGIVVCGYRYADMLYTELAECLPRHFEMLLVASARVLSQCEPNGIVSVEMPLKVHELLETVDMMERNISRRRKRRRCMPKERRPEEKAAIDEAKKLLIERNHMTEEEAHRYIQKCSMDSGTNMAETAQMVLRMMK